MDKADYSKAQSEIFEDTFLKNLKGLQAKIKQQHIESVTSKIDEGQYIGDTTRKLIELKLMELESIISTRQKEEEWIRKREIRAAQADRICQARNNLQSLLMLQEQGKLNLADDIEDNLAILREVKNIGGEEIYINDGQPSEDKILDSFHVTERDLRKAFNNTNVIDLMRQAKKNGWTMKISEDEIALFDRRGKRVLDGVEKTYDTKFIDSEHKKETKKLRKGIERSKSHKLSKKNIKVNVETVKPIKRK